MKLAEALILRATMKEQIGRYEQRISNNIRIQEGDAPSEDPNDLIAELEHSIDRLEKLIVDINKTNSATKNVDGFTITELIAKRDSVKQKQNAFQSIAYQASNSRDIRASKTEIKFIVTVDGKSMQKKVDSLAAQYRAIDSEIQMLNWATELIES